MFLCFVSIYPICQIFKFRNIIILLVLKKYYIWSYIIYWYLLVKINNCNETKMNKLKNLSASKSPI